MLRRRQGADADRNAASERRIDHPIDAEGPPVIATDVPRHEVPTATGRHELVRLDQATRRLAVAPSVPEAHLFVVSARLAEHGQRCCRNGLGGGRGAHDLDVPAEGSDSSPQSIRQDLVELGHQLQRGLLDPVDRRHGCTLQADDQCDRLVVVEQQRRNMGTHRQSIPAVHPCCSIDRVAQLPEAVDVAANRPFGHTEPVRQLRPRPVTVRLQQ